MKFRILHYLYHKNARGKMIAHCLNFDFVTSGETIPDAEKNLDAVVKFHIEAFLKSNGLSGLASPAPKKFWEEYTQCLRQGNVLPPSTLRIDVPQVVPMEKPYGELEVVAAKAA